MTRLYSSISVETTLASTISNSATTMTVAAGTGTALLGGVTLAAGNVDQFTVALDPDTANEEIVFITGASTDTFTIVRARAGTSAVSHSSGATIKHVLTSDDLNAFKGSISPVTSMGFAGSTSGTTTLQATAVAGTNTLSLPPTTTDTLAGIAATQTLTNKTLTSPIITTPTLRLSINAQTGTTYTLVAADASYKLVTASNVAAITVTVPPSIFTAGDVINLQQIGAGQVTFAQGAGVTITSTGATATAPKLRAQYSTCSIICTASNNFTVIGDIS